MASKFDDSAVVELTGKIMVIAIIVLFLVVLFVFFLHLYAKWFWYRREEDGPATTASNRRRRRRLHFSPGEEEVSPVSDGLDPSVLKSIPVVKFNSKDIKDGLECAVCLSEVADGEKARLLPKCNHGFHVECIDMWFHSHSTCPLCRNPISNNSSSNIRNTETSLEAIIDNQRAEENSSVNGHSNSTETPNFPTNVLFWGNETQVSTLGPCLEEEDHHSTASQIPTSSSTSSSSSSNNRIDGAMVIDIPRQTIEEEDTKSPLPARMRSFKRLLSRDRRVNPCSSSNVDFEQGSRGQC